GDVTTAGGALATTVAKVNGTTVPTNAAADQALMTTASAVSSWKSVPDCDDSAGNHLNYDTATHAFSCGTSSASSMTYPGAGVAVSSGAAWGTSLSATELTGLAGLSANGFVK